MATRKRRRQKRTPLLQKLKTGFSKMGTLNIVLMIVGAFFFWFNWQMLELFRLYGNLPETYACAVIAATIGECGICGWIRTNKDRKREHDWEAEEKQEPEFEQTNAIGFEYVPPGEDSDDEEPAG